MPIYEYKCQACNHRFERLIRNPSDLPTACPSCAQDTLKKQFSTFSAAVAASPADGACPAARDCPSGGCCASGKCPL